MPRLMRIACGVLLLLFAGFCVFGLLASFEPGVDSGHLFKTGYGIGGIVCLFAAGWLIFFR